MTSLESQPVSKEHTEGRAIVGVIEEGEEEKERVHCKWEGGEERRLSMDKFGEIVQHQEANQCEEYILGPMQ